MSTNFVDSPLACPALFQRTVADNQVLNLQRDAASFCSRFLFLLVHVAPDEPHSRAQQLAAAQPHALDLYRLLDGWAPAEDSPLPVSLAEQARACLLALGLSVDTIPQPQPPHGALLH